MKIFKPFIDGILKYDCKKCKGICCSHEGPIIMTAREWRILSRDYPFLKYFARPREIGRKAGRDSSVLLRRYSSCWFTDKAGRCSIQKRYGYRLKPLICRTHPYYVYRCNDEYLVRPDGCASSLVVVRDAAKNKEAKEEAKKILKNAKDSIKIKLFSGKINWTKKRLSLEKRIFQESRRYLDKTNYVGFAIRQMQMVYKGVDLENIRWEVLKKIKLWQQFLKIEDINLNNRRITYELTAITSLLRAQEYGISERGIPIVLLALYVLMLLFSHTNKNIIYLATYTAMLALAKQLIFLMDDRKTKIKLLSYAGIDKKKISSLVKNNSIVDLAEKLRLSTEERSAFITMRLS